MPTTLVDARGQLCPKPLILTKQAIKDSTPDAPITVLVDNETSCQNVERFLRDNGMAVQTTRDGSIFTIRFARNANDMAANDASPARLPPVGNASYVVSLASDTVGRGPPELGAILTKGLLETLKAVSPAPSHLVLYSSGVLLAVDGSPHADSLRTLEQRGIQVLICGTCVDYYGKNVEIHVGTISNMLTILEVQAAAGKVIAP